MNTTKSSSYVPPCAAKKVYLVLEPEVRSYLQAIAEIEDRTLVKVIIRLLKEGLKAHGAPEDIINYL